MLFRSKCAQVGPKCAQVGPKCVRGGPKSVQVGLKLAPRASKLAPRASPKPPSGPQVRPSWRPRGLQEASRSAWSAKQPEPRNLTTVQRFSMFFQGSAGLERSLAGVQKTCKNIWFSWVFRRSRVLRERQRTREYEYKKNMKFGRWRHENQH